MSDNSILVPEMTLPDTSSKAREHEREPEVMVRATQESQLSVRMEDEVHDSHDDVWRLVTRLDGLDERFDGLEKRMDKRDRVIDGRFDMIKEWTDRMREWTHGMAGTMNTILIKLDEMASRGRPAEQNITEYNRIEYPAPLATSWT